MNTPVYVCGLGMVTPLGMDAETTFAALTANRSGLAPLSLFSLCQNNPLPVGQAGDPGGDGQLPRTHRLALAAARQALSGREAPDAIVIGTTTGGMLHSEKLLRSGESNPAAYRHHGLTTVAQVIAGDCGCTGPCLTLSTACSSGALALALGMAMIRQGRARRVLAGGVDSLCRLTYFGFHSLQLVDPDGCRPLDATRRGMSVAEGAGLLLLCAEPVNALAELMGAGLSCDAHHPAAPHPGGRGANAAMRAALADADLAPDQVDYINLHGTGTLENDAAECAALRGLFSSLPPLSSIKGAIGHSLAAAGGIEAAVATLCIQKELLPANTGLQQPDPDLAVAPLCQPKAANVDTVLSNSFGFGGNNVSLVVGRVHPDTVSNKHPARSDNKGMKATGIEHGTEPAVQINLTAESAPLYVHAVAAVSGAGFLPATLARFCSRKSAAGQADDQFVCKRLDGRTIRRVGRLTRMALALAGEIASDPENRHADAVFLGTGWGSLQETHGFLTRLFDSDERFPSPTDFVGSVHNAAAGQVAIILDARGANVTCSGRDCSFEEALLAAELALNSGETGLLMAVDEGHAELAPLFDPSVAVGNLADGGGCFLVSREPGQAPLSMRLIDLGPASNDRLQAMGDFLAQSPCHCRLVLAGLPVAHRHVAEEQLARFLAYSSYDGPCLDYRVLLGQFASASALAAAVAAGLLCGDDGAASLLGGYPMAGDAVYLLGLGERASLVELALL